MILHAVSDLHGDLECVEWLLDRVPADGLLCCGDWGDPGEMEPAGLERLAARLPVRTIFGNHDDLDALRSVHNRDGSPILLETGEARRFGDYVVGGISGIRAKSNREPHYITDGQVALAAEKMVPAAATLDVLLTHGCPVGLADITREGRHGGHRCFLDALLRLRPRVHLCGHHHRPQEVRTRDGLYVVNVGATPNGDFCRIWRKGGDLQVGLGCLPMPGPSRFRRP